ncbi:MoaD/ThiS family protein [Gulosibacter chungangensis]|uniref:MoaD/ThiS family protein n=1 Tax=Gulosibacter chungangensis TaxID=979746 RepID=A0A7J5BGQ5_9MICO|nr:MoaD/ThiS family protein [Gulosibacter chungangensis]KAB1644810.1 MoaD/ThiS family protein [Gulosibacter chungangensis]
MREVRLFAAAADAAGTESVALAAATVEELRARLVEKFGDEFSRVLAQCSLLADGAKVASGPLPQGATVDVLPPFAGG